MLINHKITYETVMKTSGVRGGVASSHTKVLICRKSAQNSWKSG